MFLILEDALNDILLFFKIMYSFPDLGFRPNLSGEVETLNVPKLDILQLLILALIKSIKALVKLKESFNEKWDLDEIFNEISFLPRPINL
jgi:hypothetical protein